MRKTQNLKLPPKTTTKNVYTRKTNVNTRTQSERTRAPNNCCSNARWVIDEKRMRFASVESHYMRPGTRQVRTIAVVFLPHASGWLMNGCPAPTTTTRRGCCAVHIWGNRRRTEERNNYIQPLWLRIANTHTYERRHARNAHVYNGIPLICITWAHAHTYVTSAQRANVIHFSRCVRRVVVVVGVVAGDTYTNMVRCPKKKC